ncbi:MAG: TIGR00282 family metallophosphoesterase [Alphaproteobacteria bacterium]|nr:TIGR00282 family metallophosphoesterase [Alphaproteobacteria bacterium]
MKILFLGDIVGKSGRNALKKYLPELQQSLKPDFIIVNGENSAHGFGINKSIADELFELGVDCITLGNHAFDNADIYNWIDNEPRIVRPDNISKQAPGKGAQVIDSKNGHRVLVCNILGRVFMDPSYDNPFDSLDKLIPERGNPISNGLDAIVVDFHCEATAEKQCAGWYLDGIASLVIGTHTHIPTADSRILNNGTGYQTDAGMCGAYNSVIGMDTEIALNRILGKLPRSRHQPAETGLGITGAFIETETTTGLTKSIKNIKLGEIF